ncbi:unnamed protein product [Protopolystoma xenopodis]|uniref:Uncharacterized protein n=1 Tax=Protopolystoma xenopodis TaxID=117903 RepID=A0A3S5AQ97_9PLAT|nr:unnamed protein product [Protopolystoma xenopodis]
MFAPVQTHSPGVLASDGPVVNATSASVSHEEAVDGASNSAMAGQASATSSSGCMLTSSRLLHLQTIPGMLMTGADQRSLPQLRIKVRYQSIDVLPLYAYWSLHASSLVLMERQHLVDCVRSGPQSGHFRKAADFWSGGLLNLFIKRLHVRFTSPQLCDIIFRSQGGFRDCQ